MAVSRDWPPRRVPKKRRPGEGLNHRAIGNSRFFGTQKSAQKGPQTPGGPVTQISLATTFSHHV